MHVFDATSQSIFLTHLHLGCAPYSQPSPRW